MGQYDSIRATALRLVKSKGAEANFVRKTVTDSGGHDEAEVKEATFSLRAVMLPASPGDAFRAGSLERRRVSRMIIAAQGATLLPEPGDNVDWNGQTWSVIQSQTTDPDGSGAIICDAMVEV